MASTRTGPDGLSRTVRRAAGPARLLIDLDAGARVASLVVHGHELLVTAATSPIDWGSYPMAPWAGRVREGQFAFDGATYRLPTPFGVHALHGTVFDRPWELETEDTFVAPLAPPWPFGGFARQVVRLDEYGVSFRLEVHADREPMPAVCGWHPWFRKQLGTSRAWLTFGAGAMLQRDADGIPSGERVPVPPGPWDDCFVDLVEPPRITWPDVLDLTITSSCQALVVFDERPFAMCVEPQTAPPNALNTSPALVNPGDPLVAEMRWSWREAR